MSKGMPIDSRPHRLVFDKPFLIYLHEFRFGPPDMPRPYLAMWVATPEVLEAIK